MGGGRSYRGGGSYRGGSGRRPGGGRGGYGRDYPEGCILLVRNIPRDM